jgi:hypothetical protein
MSILPPSGGWRPAGVMRAVAVALSAAGGAAHGKMVMQTFPVLARRISKGACCSSA